MAIAFDAATDGGNNGGSSNTRSFSHTATGSNLIALVCFLGDVVVTGVDDVTSVTYDGNACTLVQKQTTGTAAANRFSYIYAIAGPPTGAKTVTITCNASHYILAGCASYSGVNQSTTMDNLALNNTAGATSLTSSITPIADNCWMFIFENVYSTGNPAAGTGATRRVFEGAFGTWGIFDNNAAITPAASTSMQTTVPVSTPIQHNILTMAPPGAAPSGSGILVKGGQLTKGALIRGGRLVA